MIIQIVAGVVRRGNDVLVVEQQSSRDPAPSWVLPGGVVEPGELLHEALARELREETGLTVLGTPQLAYMVQCDVAAEARQVQVFICEVPSWQGEIAPDDPDELIIQAVFVPLDEAVRLLRRLPYPHMWQPVSAYLAGGAAPGAVWLYRRDASNVETLAAHMRQDGP